MLVSIRLTLQVITPHIMFQGILKVFINVRNEMQRVHDEHKVLSTGYFYSMT